MTTAAAWMTRADWDRAVAANPLDVVTRMAFADWLRESGKDRDADHEEARIKRHHEATALHAALRKVNYLTVPVKTRDRHVGMKEQARLCRELFRELKLPHLSVTQATGSMCTWVNVRFPELIRGPLEDRQGNRLECPNRDLNRWCERVLEDILLIAFPNHEDRSDFQSDYHSSCWSVSGRDY
jgi:uncharacterized protein (TIGR02996 family)